ncbi:MAG: hypothetical protein ABS81_08205 [Pseudonocardia sp. SCN 72-86]|nr:MAG: hypothetical protein ABS81_08205 [Pseudonocardia sp. SCN 72-86]
MNVQSLNDSITVGVAAYGHDATRDVSVKSCMTQRMNGAFAVVYSPRMANRERATFSLDGTTIGRIRQCAATSRGGASGYIERLVREDAMRDAVAKLEQFHQDNPSYAEDALAEIAAAQAEA